MRCAVHRAEGCAVRRHLCKGTIVIKIDDLAQLAGLSVRFLEHVASAVEEQRPFVIYVYRNAHGGVRHIVRPSDTLSSVCKNLHRALSAELAYETPDHVHGFVKGRSIKTNAREHLAKDCVLRVDLQEFFPSIRKTTIVDVLMREGLDEDAATLTSRIVTIDGTLPIGLSSSPLLSNLAFKGTDDTLAAFAVEQGLSFTRYVDDLIFSGTGVNDDTLGSVRAIVEGGGWTINDRKTAFMRRGGPQYVTGLYVGREDGPHIPRRIKRQLRWIRHMIDKFDYETFLSEFGGEEEQLYPRRLKGWARHIASIEPDFGYDLWRFLDAHIPEGYAEMPEIDSPVGLRVLRTLADIGIGSDTFEGGARGLSNEERR